ncbi:outer membrane beta-barrel protein [Sediminibacterium salmoneum]|uniref:outer membrane beta-barrel protein n=2 Tax=Sediminibacterium TaxID=504481 RepID=UPI0004790BE6|nr:outer membrane beta-barrel protein [Sediminibacterium salmoneum]
MKSIVSMVAMICIAVSGSAQSSSETDTIKVGNFVIIKKKGSDDNSAGSVRINKDNYNLLRVERRPAKRKNLSTNWWIVDLGFANMRDNTDYGYAQAGSYFRTFRPQDGPVNENSYRLNTGKSSNVNLWFFMQKLNVSKNVLNLKYGLGLEMYNFRYDSRLSYNNSPTPYVFNDSISFTKNKLYAGYLTVPFMININTTPDKRKGFSFSAGVSAGYLIASRNKQISAERGKVKEKADFYMEPFRLAAIGEIGLGPVRLYGSYSLNKLQKDVTRLEQYPFVVGVRLSTW